MGDREPVFAAVVVDQGPYQAERGRGGEERVVSDPTPYPLSRPGQQQW